MDRAQRAKIFMPFSALKGYYELILSQEEGHQVRQEADEDKAMMISDKLNKLRKGSSIKVRYFECGNYFTQKGVVSRIDFAYRYLAVNDKKVWFDDITDIEDYVPEGRETWGAEDR